MANGTLQMWFRLRTLRWEDYTGLFKWVWSIHMSPYKAGSHSWLQKAGNGSRGRTQPVSLALQMEEEATGWGMQVIFRNWKRQGHKFPAQVSRKKYSFAHTLILTQWDWCWTSDLQNSKIINSSCSSHSLCGKLATMENTHMHTSTWILRKTEFQF